MWEFIKLIKFKIMKKLYLYYIFVNLLGFAICSLDKYYAHSGLYRFSEKILASICLSGGAPGLILSCILFKHKVKKP